MKHLQIQSMSVPALGFGTYELSGDECYEAVSDAIELGYRHIDTAQNYGNESEVGRAIDHSRVSREDLFVTTKIWWEDLERPELLQHSEQSLERLRTSYIDLLLIHWPSPDLSPSEPLQAMNRLREEGKIRLVGVSNFTPALIEKALRTTPIACNQVEYHPFLAQGELLDLAREHGFLLTAYSPVARGKVQDDPTLQEIGERYDKSPAQVALRWLLQQDPVAAIPRAASAEHRRENLEVFDFELSRDEMESIFGLAREERLIDPEFAPNWRT